MTDLEQQVGGDDRIEAERDQLLEECDRLVEALRASSRDCWKLSKRNERLAEENKRLRDKLGRVEREVSGLICEDQLECWHNKRLQDRYEHLLNGLRTTVDTVRMDESAEPAGK